MITQVIQHPEYVTVKEIEVILNTYAKKVTREVEVKYYRTDFTKCQCAFSIIITK